MDWGLAKVLPRGGVADERPSGQPEPERHGHRDGRGAARTATRSQAGSRAGHARRTWRPSRPGASWIVSTSGPTSSAWARSSARSSPASRRSSAAIVDEIRRQAARGRHGRAWPARRSAAPTPSWCALARLPGRRARRPAAQTPRQVARRMNAYLAGVQDGSRPPSWPGSRRRRKPSRSGSARGLAVALAASVLAPRGIGRRRLDLPGTAAGGASGAVQSCPGRGEARYADARQAGDDLARWRGWRMAAHALEGLLADAPNASTRNRVTALIRDGTEHRGRRERSDAAGEAGGHPQRRGRRPRRLGHRRRICRRLSRGRARPG